MAKAPPFVHLHVHTNFSFGDGACRIDELVATAAETGMAAVACTDHDGLYGAVRFYQACQKAGVKPIVGVELNVESVLEADRLAQAGAGRVPAAQLTVAEALKLAQHSWSRRAATEAADAWQADEARAIRAAKGAGGRAVRRTGTIRQPGEWKDHEQTFVCQPAGRRVRRLRRTAARADRGARLPPGAARQRLRGLEQPLPHHQRRPPGAPGRAAVGALADHRRALGPSHRPVGLPPR